VNIALWLNLIAMVNKEKPVLKNMVEFFVCIVINFKDLTIVFKENL